MYIIGILLTGLTYLLLFLIYDNTKTSRKNLEKISEQNDEIIRYMKRIPAEIDQDPEPPFRL